MTLPYLKNGSWSKTTREERQYCAELYSLINKPDALNNFVQKVNEKKDAFDPEKNNRIPINPEEIGFEVNLFRDESFYRRIGMKDQNFPKSRHYDMCLFYINELVIIEAKAEQSLDLDQLNGESERIRGLYKTANVPHLCPEIGFFFILSSKYTTSEIRKVRLTDILTALGEKTKYYGCATWCDLSDVYENKKESFQRADSIYGVKRIIE